MTFGICTSLCKRASRVTLVSMFVMNILCTFVFYFEEDNIFTRIDKKQEEEETNPHQIARFESRTVSDQLKKKFADFDSLGGRQCDQIGRFLEFLGNKIYYKSSPNVW